MIKRVVELSLNNGKVRGDRLGFVQKVKPMVQSRQACLYKDDHISNASIQIDHLCRALCPVKREYFNDG